MKAKEYFKEYEENLSKAKTAQNGIDHKYVCFALCLQKLLHEVKTIQKARKAIKDDAMTAIFKQQNMKANALAKMVNCKHNLGIERDVFKEFVKHQKPELNKLIKWDIH